MTITYQADDGYVGVARPQRCHVPDDEIQECDSVEEAVGLIEQAILDDFSQKVHATWDSPKVQKEIEKLMSDRKD